MTFYNSIHNLPIYHFFKISETNNYELLIVDKSEKLPKGVDLQKVWIEIYNEYLTEFGVSEKQKEYFKLLQEATELYGLVAEGQNDKLTFAMIKDVEINELQNSFQGGSFKTLVVAIENQIGRDINVMEMSTWSFFSKVEFLKEK